MNKSSFITIILIICFLIHSKGQISSSSDFLIANPIPDRTIFFKISDTGVYKPVIWGLDLAWLSEENIKRGITFIGKERISLIRSSFTPTDSLINGELKENELNILNERLRIIDLLDTSTRVMLNCDHPSVHQWYKGYPQRWAQLIDVTARHHEQHGRKIVSVAPFNEPDYIYTDQGNLTDF